MALGFRVQGSRVPGGELRGQGVSSCFGAAGPWEIAPPLYQYLVFLS